MSVIVASGSEDGKDREPRNEAEAERALLNSPMSLGYKARAPMWGLGDFQGGMVAAQLSNDIEFMLLHPHVQQAYGYYKAGISHAQFQVSANSPEVKRFIEIMIRRFWERSLDQVQLAYDYGWGGYEVMYGRESGYLTYQHLQDFSPFDVWSLTKKHRYVGVQVNNVPRDGGQLRLWGPCRWPAKGFWMTHNKRWNKWYGRSALFAAWLPWRRLAFKDGLEQVCDGAWYRLGYHGPEVRYPLKRMRAHGTTGDGCDTNGQESARAKAMEIQENAKAGIGFALPNTRDDKGEYEWQVNFRDNTLNIGGLIDVVKYLQDQISYGIGVPPELLEASEVGSGWSGRMIPMLGFYTGQLKNARAIVWQWMQQIGIPLVRWNFGPKAKFEVNVTLKVPDELTNMGGQQPQGQPGQQPPKPGQAPGAAPAPAAPPGGQPKPPQGQQQQPGGQPVQFSTLPFDLDPEPELPPPPPPVHWGRIVTQDAPHLRIIGPSGSGKTTVAEALAANLPGKLLVIDPVWEPGSWGGLPAATVDPTTGSFEPIAQAIAGLTAEMRRRQSLLQSGKKDFERLTILWDEVPNTVMEVPAAGEFIRRVANYGRHADMHLIGIGQSSSVGSWGIPGYGDTSENFATILLGNKALEVMPELTGTVERPAVLEWQGTRQALDLTPVLAMAQQHLDPSRAFVLPAAAAQAEPIQLSTEYESLYDQARLAARSLLSEAR